MRWIAWTTGLCIVWTMGMLGVAVAGIVGPHGVGKDADALVPRWERELVFQWMKDYGVADAQAANRLAELTDAEVHDMVLQAENMGLPYGGDSVGLIVGILLVLILLIILLRLLNKEVVVA